MPVASLAMLGVGGVVAAVERTGVVGHCIAAVGGPARIVTETTTQKIQFKGTVTEDSISKT